MCVAKKKTGRSGSDREWKREKEGTKFFFMFLFLHLIVASWSRSAVHQSIRKAENREGNKAKEGKWNPSPFSCEEE